MKNVLLQMQHTELRTPLAAIRMYAQVLLSARSTEEARESAKHYDWN